MNQFDCECDNEMGCVEVKCPSDTITAPAPPPMS